MTRKEPQIHEAMTRLVDYSCGLKLNKTHLELQKLQPSERNFIFLERHMLQKICLIFKSCIYLFLIHGYRSIKLAKHG